MKKRVWMIIAVVAFIGAGVLVFGFIETGIRKEVVNNEYKNMQEQDEENAEKRQQISEESEETTQRELDIPVDFEKLQKSNSDIYAWITIPGTDIDYPVLQSETDNSYYLNHSAEKTESVNGAIFSENYNSKNFDDYITVLYGHNMRDGSMFAELHDYEDKSFMKKHSDITVYLPDAILKYKIFAAYLADDKHVLLQYNQGKTADNRKAYINEIMSKRTMDASLDTTVDLDENTKILTLSTCHKAGKNHRYLVQAYLAEELRN